MKNPLTVLLFTFLFTQPIFAQRNGVDDIDRENFFRIGAKAGVNVNKIFHTAYKNGFDFNYQIGGFMQFNFSKRFGIQPEANFVQSTSTFSSDATDISDDLFRSGSQKDATFNYLEIPILLNINVGETRHVKLQAGPSLGMFLKNKPVNTESENLQYKNGELSMLGGLWIQLPFINIGGRYKYGLSKVYDAVAMQKVNNQAIEIFMGFTF